MTDLAEWLTQAQAAEHVGRSPRTIERWRLDGEVEAYPVRGIVALLHRQSLEQCAATQAIRYAERKAGRPPAENNN